MSRSLAATLVLATVLLAACGARAGAPGESSAPSPAAPAVVEGAAQGAASAAAVRPAAPAADGQRNATTGLNVPSFDRMIVSTVRLTLEVADVDAAFQEAGRIATSLGGHVLDSSFRLDADRPIATITVRVPAQGETLQTALERLRGLGTVRDESLQSQDVTEEFVDLEARLRTLRATETQLIALMERAERVEDVLAIHRELTAVRGEIERVQGRQEYLRRRSEYATIALQLTPIPAQAPLVENGWSPVATARAALRALVVAFEGLGTLVIWVVVLSPLWGVPLGVLWLLVRAWRRARQRPAAA
ncbi:MAG TPA: DUF4349 domain-containing protein [Chloroflexota bacterium]